MDLDSLNVFLKVAEEGGFTPAATRLCRTQPAVSQAIKRLESELNTTLFNRDSRGGQLTDAGRCLIGYAKNLLHLRDEALSALKDMGSLLRGRLALGANESTTQFFLPPILKSYREAFPDIKVEVYRGDSERIPALISERNLDLGFLSYEPGDPRLEAHTVYRDKLQMVVHSKHPLANKAGVDPVLLGQEAFIAHNAKTPSRRAVVSFFAQRQIPLVITMELDSLHVIKHFVAQGLGAAIIPHLSVADEIRCGALCPVEVRGLDISKNLVLVKRKGQAPAPAAQAFLEIMAPFIQAQIPKFQGET